MSASITSPTDACGRLQQADAAYHLLSIGQQVVTVTDENGERVEFSRATRAGLLAYIRVLQGQCRTYRSTALPVHSVRPLGFVF